MASMYGISFSATAATVAVDFFEIINAATKVCVLHQVNLGQTTELGDAAEEVLQIKFVRGVGSVTSGSGGTGPTPAKLETGDSAASVTAEVMNTTQMAVGTGTITTIGILPWNVRSEFMYLPTPENRIILAPSERLAIGLVAAPSDSISFLGTAWIEEIG